MQYSIEFHEAERYSIISLAGDMDVLMLKECFFAFISSPSFTKDMNVLVDCSDVTQMLSPEDILKFVAFRDAFDDTRGVQFKMAILGGVDTAKAIDALIGYAHGIGGAQKLFVDRSEAIDWLTS